MINAFRGGEYATSISGPTVAKRRARWKRAALSVYPETMSGVDDL